jgi:surface protein
MDILRKTKNGINIDEIRTHLSLPGTDKKQVEDSKRSELNKLLIIALNVSKVETPKVVYATQEDLKLHLGNTILPKELINIILKYTETIIKVEFDDSKTEYYSQSQFNDLDCGNVVNIDIYGVLILTNPSRKFCYTKIQKITGCVVLIGDTSNMFYNAINFNSDISDWDTSKVTNMKSMFSYATNFNQDISFWDTSKVESMGYMFFNAKNFDQDISSWDTSKVEYMYHMFDNETKFKGTTKKVKGIWKILYQM